MWLRLLLRLYLLAIVIERTDSSFVNPKWVNVFKSFFGETSPVASVEDSPLDEKDARVKRSILASLGAQINCEAGYTGQFCESPICGFPIVPPTITNQPSSRLIDIFYLRQLCAGNVTFPLDSESQSLHIQVLTNEGELNGNVTLINDQGIVVPPTIGGGGQWNYANPAAGQYQVKIDAASSNIIYCDVEITTFTALTADIGFVNRPNEDAFTQGIAYARPQYIVAHPFFLIQPATINVIYIYENQRDHTRYVMRLQPRYGCGYEYYAGEFICDTSIISYRWVVEGIDYRGFLWRRSGSFVCANPVTIPAPTTVSPPQPDYCMNNGTLYIGPNGLRTCYCGELFTGYNCENALCMNGGTPTFDGVICGCPEGFSGSHCQDVQCTYETVSTEYLTERKSLITVIRQSTAIMSQAANIIGAINMTVNGYFGGTEVFSNYILVIYGNNEALVTEYNANEYNSFITAINLTLTGNAWSDACTDDVIAGITAAFTANIIYHKSPIFVFTDVPPSDYANWTDVYTPNSFRKLPIYTFFLTDNSTVCYNQTDTLSPGYITLQDISLLSGGLLYTPSVVAYGILFEQTLLRTTWMANYITFNEMNKCSMANRQSFIVDRSVQTVSIIATGISLSLTITDPAWVVLNASRLVNVFNDGKNYIWDFVDNLPGQYLYFIQSTGGGTNAPCSFRVVAKSNVDMFVGASAGLQGDMGVPDPVYGYNANMVVHFNGFAQRPPDAFRLFSEMQINTWNRNQLLNQPIYYSSGIWRSGCTFHLYFGGFNCPERDQRYIVTVFADDEIGFPIQRSWPAYCVSTPFNTNTTIAPNGQCFNGGVPNPLNTTQCICPYHWTGQNCTYITCDNNGTSQGSYCQCPALTGGTFCEYLVCQAPQPGISFDPGNRALAFVLNIASSMNNTLQDVANNAAILVRDLFMADGRYISYYIVATFTISGGSVVNVIPANNYNLFVQNLNDAVAASNQQPPVDPNNCNGQISMAIQDVINQIRNYNTLNSQVFVFTDSDFGPNITITDAQALVSAQDTKTTLNFVATSYTLCGTPAGQNGTSELMREMARSTAGLIYYTTHAGDLLQVIPTFYSSGLIAGGESADCNTNPITYYLPIDGWSQAFTITAIGAGVNINVTAPAEVANQYDYLNEIDRDTYLHIHQYIIPCDGTGQVAQQGQYCYIIHNVERFTWYQSSENCHQAEAYLVDVLTSDINTFISGFTGNNAFWIGLYRDPGTNNWHWDNYRFNNLTFNNNTDFSNWGVGEPSTAGDCVVSRPDNNGIQRWYMDNCNITYLYVCQKHKYGQTLMPRDPTVNRLPSGIWQVTVSSNATGTNATCFFEARIQSQIQIYFGYVLDNHNDYPASYGNILSNSNYYAAHTTGLEPLNADNIINQVDGRLNYALLFNPNGTLYYSARFQERLICSYGQISQSFACPGYQLTNQKTNFFTKFSGIDQYGNLFERYAATFCTGTITCARGYLVNGICLCEAYWEGPTCAIPVCLNGGTVRDSSCQCITDFAGPHCEYPNCQDPERITFNDTGVTLAILLETSAKTGNTIFYLRNNLARIIANVTSAQVTSPQWISNYILVPFDSQSNEQYWYPKVSSTNFNDINASLQTIGINNCPYNNTVPYICETGSNCPRPILRVLNNTLNDPTFVNQNSIVLIITASNVMDYGLLNEVHDNAEAKRATVNVLVVDIAAPCGNFSYDSPETIALYLIAQMTGGDFFYTSAKAIVANLLPYYLPTLYRTAHLGTIIDRRNCSDETIYFPIDQGTSAISISYTGPGAGGITFSLTDSLRNNVTLDGGYQLYEYTYFIFLDVINQISNPPGTWKLRVQAPLAQTCVLTVRLRSSIEVYVGFTDESNTPLYGGALLDSPHSLLSANIPNGIVLHVNNLGNGTLNYVVIYGAGGNVLYSSELIQRINCNFEWWAPAPFFCTYGIYVISAHGYDRTGKPFIRNIPIQCASNRPPRPPPQPRCDPSILTYDIALVLDISTRSLTVGNTTWGDFVSALSRALGNYYPPGGTFSTTGTQLAIIGVASVANTRLIYSFADSNGRAITDLLVNVPQLVDPNADYGQNLPAAIPLLRQLSTNASLGYRNGTAYPNVRHLAIYATINGAQTEGGQPADDVHSLTRSGIFGFAVVGANNTYYDSAFRTNLETLATFPCLYFSIDNPINTYIPYYINDLTCSRFPLCSDAAQNDTIRTFSYI